MLSPAQETFIPNHCRGFLVHTRELFACFPAQHSCSPYKTGTLPQVPAALALKVYGALSRVHTTGANIPRLPLPLPDLEMLPGVFYQTEMTTQSATVSTNIAWEFL